MRRVLPEARWVKLDKTHRVFDSFFRMTTIDFPHPMTGILPTYYGIYEDNDPTKRLMVDREPQPRRRGVLGVLGNGILFGGPVERGVQARRELHAVWTDSLEMN